MATAQQSKKKCRQYSVEYLKYGFIPASHNSCLCVCCVIVFTNDSMEPYKLSEHFKKSIPIKQINAYHIFNCFEIRF